MFNKIHKNRGFLKNIALLKKSKRNKLIRKATSDNIDSISEIALNALHGNIILDKKSKKKLNKHIKKIEQLAKNNISVQKKKKFLIQHGGFIPLLITPVLTTLAGLAAKALGNAIGI